MNQSHDAHEKFVEIQEAYECILCEKQGKPYKKRRTTPQNNSSAQPFTSVSPERIQIFNFISNLEQMILGFANPHPGSNPSSAVVSRYLKRCWNPNFTEVLKKHATRLEKIKIAQHNHYLFDYLRPSQIKSINKAMIEMAGYDSGIVQMILTNQEYSLGHYYVKWGCTPLAWGGFLLMVLYSMCNN